MDAAGWNEGSFSHDISIIKPKLKIIEVPIDEKGNILPSDTEEEEEEGAELKELRKTLKKISVDDGCLRDETGYVPPQMTAIQPVEVPLSNTYYGRSFPIDTPTEELLKFEPPEHIVAAWKKLQEQLNDAVATDTHKQKLFQEMREEKIENPTRQARRAAARKAKKDGTKARKIERLAKQVKTRTQNQED